MGEKSFYTQHHKCGIGLYEYTTPHAMNNPHYHDTYEFYLQLDGVRYITFNENTYKLQKGDLAIIVPYILHSTDSKDSAYSKRYCMNVYTPLMNTILPDEQLDAVFSKLSTCVVHLDEDKFDNACHIFSNIFNYRKRRDIVGIKLFYSTILLLVDFLSELKIASEVTEAGMGDSIVKALNYINNNYMENITLDFISKYVNMSKSNFCLVFNKTIGETFVQYLNHVRISHVHRLLAETDMKINKIAEATGFKTASYMASVFKQFNGFLPSEFRKNEF